MPITTVWPWPYRAAPVCITHTQLPLWPHLGPLNQSLEPIRVSPSPSPPPPLSSVPDTTDGFCLQGGASSLTAAAVNLALPQPSQQESQMSSSFRSTSVAAVKYRGWWWWWQLLVISSAACVIKGRREGCCSLFMCGRAYSGRDESPVVRSLLGSPGWLYFSCWLTESGLMSGLYLAKKKKKKSDSSDCVVPLAVFINRFFINGAPKFSISFHRKTL